MKKANTPLMLPSANKNKINAATIITTPNKLYKETSLYKDTISLPVSSTSKISTVARNSTIASAVVVQNFNQCFNNNLNDNLSLLMKERKSSLYFPVKGIRSDKSYKKDKIDV
jgi:hypothetical protein